MTRRTFSTPRAVLAFTIASLGAILVAAPVVASAPPSYGTVVNCKYPTTANMRYSFAAPLKRIVVGPPRIFAKSGHQTVGWRFAVQRLIDTDPNPAWTVTYRSPIAKAVATTYRRADFDAMRVGVRVPNWDPEDWHSADADHYRVVVTMLWYRANGSVQSRIPFVVPSYTLYVNGEWWDQGAECSGSVWQIVEGPFD